MQLASRPFLILPPHILDRPHLLRGLRCPKQQLNFHNSHFVHREPKSTMSNDILHYRPPGWTEERVSRADPDDLLSLPEDVSHPIYIRTSCYF